MYRIVWGFGIVVAVIVVVVVAVRIVVRRRGREQRRQLKKQYGGEEPLVVAFFHPYCNDGGGGERVLWCGVKAFLDDCYGEEEEGEGGEEEGGEGEGVAEEAMPSDRVRCSAGEKVGASAALRSCSSRKVRRPVHVCVYSGDVTVTPEEIHRKVRQHFGIGIGAERWRRHVEFVPLRSRPLVEARFYPVATMVGQSLGSCLLALEGCLRLRPDVVVDSMGYSFTFPVFRFLASPRLLAAYVHYPTISTDMLGRVWGASPASWTLRLRRLAKSLYYRAFALTYGLMGSCCSVVMVNSSWTKGNIDSLWCFPSPFRIVEGCSIVFPPTDTSGLRQLPLHEERSRVVMSLAQFRPEKDHALQIRAFAKALSQYRAREGGGGASPSAWKLVLVGSVRQEADGKRVEELRQLADSLGLREGAEVQFAVNASFQELRQLLSHALLGIHTMWCEHFGIGVVEFQASGAITLAHNSGGPAADIVVPATLSSDLPPEEDLQDAMERLREGNSVGFLAASVEEYAHIMEKIFLLDDPQHPALRDMRQRARDSVDRFSEESFTAAFLHAMQPVVDMYQ